MVSVSTVLMETHVLYVEALAPGSHLYIEINREAGTAQRRWDWRIDACWIPMSIQLAEQLLAAYATSKLRGGLFNPLSIIYSGSLRT